MRFYFTPEIAPPQTEIVPHNVSSRVSPYEGGETL